MDTQECCFPTRRCSQWSSVLMLKMTVCTHHHHSKLQHVFPECKGSITQHQSWRGVSFNGTTQLHFCEHGVKTSAHVYQTTVLEPIIKPLNTTMLPNQQWTCQQDSAPANTARTTQEWLRANVPDFISTSDWLSSSPDLNPLDYKLWSVLQTMACKKTHPNVDSLKRVLV